MRSLVPIISSLAWSSSFKIQSNSVWTVISEKRFLPSYRTKSIIFYNLWSSSHITLKAFVICIILLWWILSICIWTCWSELAEILLSVHCLDSNCTWCTLFSWNNIKSVGWIIFMSFVSIKWNLHDILKFAIHFSIY